MLCRAIMAEQNSLIKMMKVPDLKKLLKEKGLSTVGNKSELIARLEGRSVAGTSLQSDTSLDDTDDILEENGVTASHSGNLTASVGGVATITPPTKPTIKPVATAPVDSTSVKPKINKIDAPPRAPNAEDKLKERQKRFGVELADTKLQSRAERFKIAASSAGEATSTSAKSQVTITPVTKTPVVFTSTNIIEEQEKLKKRSERFGSTGTTSAESMVGGTSTAKSADALKKRQERFGQVTSSTLTKADEQDRVLKRKARFGVISGPSSDIGSDPKKMKRAERFGLTAVAT